eukprot:m.4575 g.4575  ORF g.4575 m.4575 type:complete len:171 (+) comp10970_c0_seq2:83-595(+)
MSVRKPDDESKAKKARKKRKRTHKRKGSEVRARSTEDKSKFETAKPALKYELSELPADFKRYYPPEVSRARELFLAVGGEGRASSSSHSSIENDRPQAKQKAIGSGLYSYGSVSSVLDKDCADTVRWKLKEGEGLEAYKRERRKRYEAAFEQKKLVLAMEKAQLRTGAKP